MKGRYEAAFNKWFFPVLIGVPIGLVFGHALFRALIYILGG